MYYPFRTQALANTLSLNSRGRWDKYSVYQQMVAGVTGYSDNLHQQLIISDNNKYLSTYDFRTLSSIKYKQMPLDSDLGILPSDHINATASFGSVQLKKAGRLNEFIFGDNFGGYFTKNAGDLSISGVLVDGFEITEQETSLVDDSKYIYSQDNYIYITANFASDLFLYDSPISATIYGLNLYGSPIFEDIEITKNGSLKTVNNYNRLTSFVINDFTSDLQDALLADPIILSISSVAPDKNYPIYLNNLPEIIDAKRDIIWKVESNKLKAQYGVALSSDDYFAGLTEYDNYNIYTLQNSAGTAITPVAFTIDYNSPYIYVTDTNDKLHVYTKSEEYPGKQLLIDAKGSTYISEVIVEVEYTDDYKVILSPSYTNHRRGRQITDYELSYRTEAQADSFSTTEYVFNGSSFTLGAPYPVPWDNQGYYGFFHNPITLTLSPGFYLVRLKVYYDDGSYDIYKRIIYQGFKKALLSFDLPASTTAENFDLYVDRYGRLNLIEIAGFGQANVREHRIFELKRLYYLYDDNDKIIYLPKEVTAISWTGVNTVGYSYSGTDIKDKNIFCEIDDLGLFAGLERELGETAESFYNDILLMAANKPNSTLEGQLNIAKDILHNAESDTLVMDINKTIYNVTAAVADVHHIYLEDPFLYIVATDGTIKYKIDITRTSIADIKIALSLFFTIGTDSEIVDIADYNAFPGLFLVPFDNKKTVFNDKLYPNTYNKLPVANVLMDTVVLSDPNVAQVNDLSHLTYTNQRAYYVDVADESITFNFVPTGSLGVSYSYLVDEFDIKFSALRPVSLIGHGGIMVDLPYNNSALSTELISEIIDIENNRWG